jgi:ACS family allantoate permease-like MFS transporter
MASVGLLIGALGQLLIAVLPQSNKHGRLAGYYMTQTGSTGFVTILSLISSNVAGYTKKTIIAALYLIFYCAGNIIGPQVYLTKYAPQYLLALEAGVMLWVFCAADLIFIGWWFKRQNKKKAEIRAMPGYTTLRDQEFLDLTDGENPEFVYRL